MKIKFFLLCLFLFVCFCGCESTSQDGDWDAMKWKTDFASLISSDGKNIDVPVNGGEYVFVCKNYEGVWLKSVVTINEGFEEKKYYPDGYFDDTQRTDFSLIHSPWVSVKADNEKVIVSIEPNADNNKRTIIVSVTAGDIFDSFTFNQASK